MITKNGLLDRARQLGEQRAHRIYATPKNARISENVPAIEEKALPEKVKVRRKK